MIINSKLFEAYLECPTKCWLRSRAEPAKPNYYAEWARAQNETYLEYGLIRLLVPFAKSDQATAPPIPKNPKDVTWCLAIDALWRTKDLESSLQAVERIPSEGHGHPAPLGEARRHEGDEGRADEREQPDDCERHELALTRITTAARTAPPTNTRT